MPHGTTHRHTESRTLAESSRCTPLGRQSSEVNEGIFIPLDEMIVPQRFEEIPFHFARGSAYVSLDVLAMLYEKEFALYLVADG